MRLIDADDFRHRMYHEVFEKDSEDQRWDSGCWMRYRLFDRVLEEQPTVEQPKPRIGKWLIRKFGDDGKCSVCGMYCGEYDLEGSDRYCRCCGAKMEGLQVDK